MQKNILLIFTILFFAIKFSFSQIHVPELIDQGKRLSVIGVFEEQMYDNCYKVGEYFVFASEIEDDKIELLKNQRVSLRGRLFIEKISSEDNPDVITEKKYIKSPYFIIIRN